MHELSQAGVGVWLGDGVGVFAEIVKLIWQVFGDIDAVGVGEGEAVGVAVGVGLPLVVGVGDGDAVGVGVWIV